MDTNRRDGKGSEEKEAGIKGNEREERNGTTYRTGTSSFLPLPVSSSRELSAP